MKRILIPLVLGISILLPQNGSVTGTVTDADRGDVLIGANVIIKGSGIGSATDFNGAYILQNVPPGDQTLSVSYIGYESKEIPVTIEASLTTVLNFELLPEAIEMETYVVTASRRREKVQDAPAAITVVTQREIRRESNTNLGDYLKSIKGVDFTQSGVDSYNMSARGFNSSLASRLLTLTDGRVAAVPSIRVIAYNVIPVSFDDVKQFEVVLGPSSALYGPNAHSGVLNIITSSPKESVGTTFNLQTGVLAQRNGEPLRKVTMRHASAWGNFGIKVSGVAMKALDWIHYNNDEFEGHEPGLLGWYPLLRDGIDNNNSNGSERDNPRFTKDFLEEISVGEIPKNGIDDNGNGFIDEDMSMYTDTNGNGVWDSDEYGFMFADGIKNRRPIGVESGNPFITQDMVDMATDEQYNRLCVDGDNISVFSGNCSGIVLWFLDDSDVDRAYKDGIDNDGDGLIDESIDTGIDETAELFYDGFDNDGDGLIDEDDEIVSNYWLNRFEDYYGVDDTLDLSTVGFGFGDYTYDSDGNIIFDTNKDGVYGGTGDFDLKYDPERPRWMKDSNNDGIDDFPDFNVENYRYDIRADWDPNSDVNVSLAHGLAFAKNINLTGIARYLADGWIYRYYQGRFRYKNFFLQTYLNSSYAGDPGVDLNGDGIFDSGSPTRNLATGGTIFDKSIQFSAQFQHMIEAMNGNLRFVWGVDYFMTRPDTRGSILADNEGHDRRDNNGNGEAGSPTSFSDDNLNYLWDTGREQFLSYDVMNYDSTFPGGDTIYIDDAVGAIADGIDNDGDGLIDEGIDEKNEDNRYVVNELGAYYQLNWKLNDKVELIQATRFDAHDRLTELIDFNNQDKNYDPFKWAVDWDKQDGIQVSPKIGFAYKPMENQNFRLTWAKAFNTPSNQALFLDIFVTRVATFRVFARGAYGGYNFPRTSSGGVYWKDPYASAGSDYAPVDTSRHVLYYPSVDPRFNGYFLDELPDLGSIEPELVHTTEFGYKGRLARNLFGTLDIYLSHYNSFVSPVMFITPLVLNRDVFEDYNEDGIGANNYPGAITDAEDYDEALRRWRSYIEGVTALDTTAGLNPPVVVGYVNYGEVDMGGVDMSLTWLINRDLSFNLNYSFMSITDFINPITGGKDPINAPKNKGGFKLQYDPKNKNYTLSLNARYVDSFPWSSGIYFGQIGPYVIADVHAQYKFNENLRLYFSVANLFNHYHVEIMGGPRLGRMASLRIQASM